MGAKIRTGDSGTIAFKCPGCGDIHALNVGSGPGPHWTYNGNPEAPTLHPSILATSGHHCSGHVTGSECWCTYDDAHPDDPSGFKCYVCHSFVVDGRIRFLSDCTHALAGQTVDLPTFEP
jgi:hypothetical protein